MLNVEASPIIMSVVMLNVVMLSVVAPNIITKGMHFITFMDTIYSVLL